MLPISELRGAIPYGLACGLPFSRVVAVALAGNLLPVVPLFFFLQHILNWLGRLPGGRRFTGWLVARTLEKSRMIEIYKTLGLLVFVGIPLPMTGAWTGTMAAVLLGMKFRDYLVGTVGGVLLAALIVSLVSLGVISLF